MVASSPWFALMGNVYFQEMPCQFYLTGFKTNPPGKRSWKYPGLLKTSFFFSISQKVHVNLHSIVMEEQVGAPARRHSHVTLASSTSICTMSWDPTIRRVSSSATELTLEAISPASTRHTTICERLISITWSNPARPLSDQTHICQFALARRPYAHRFALARTV
jgi:hypothetical protein